MRLLNGKRVTWGNNSTGHRYTMHNRYNPSSGHSV